MPEVGLYWKENSICECAKILACIINCSLSLPLERCKKWQHLPSLANFCNHQYNFFFPVVDHDRMGLISQEVEKLFATRLIIISEAVLLCVDNRQFLFKIVLDIEHFHQHNQHMDWQSWSIFLSICSARNI